jgi:hypothetical protein
MNNDDYYYEIKQQCTVVKELLDFVTQDHNFEVVTFLQKTIPEHIVKKDPVLSYFNDLNFSLKIIKMFPNSFYDWHRDSGVRGCGINLLLNPVRCITLFREDSYFLQRQKKIVELAYKPFTYYMLNTSADHSVVNFDQHRFSVSLFPPRDSDFVKERNQFNEYLKIIKLAGL